MHAWGHGATPKANFAFASVERNQLGLIEVKFLKRGIVKQRNVHKQAEADILKIEETQEALRESIELTKQLAERAETIIQKNRRPPPEQQ